MKNLFCCCLFLILSFNVMSQENQLSPWKEGFMDIHHISTGYGNSTFIIFPDGTTMIIDAGDMTKDASGRRAPAMPDDSKTVATWIFDYINEFKPDKNSKKIDYMMLTHFHDDHMGMVNETKRLHPEGKYFLTGITELGSLFQIRNLIDRGYDEPVNFKDTELQKGYQSDPTLKTLLTYWKFIEFQTRSNGLKYQKFKVGSTSQIRLLNKPEAFPSFQVKNLFSDGNISNSWDTLVSISKYKHGEYPGENPLSAGIRISYGKFDYYTGGDIPGTDYNGQIDLNSMESLAAPVIGPVDVAVLNHHGNRDSQNAYYVRTIRPRVWIGFSWSSDHPGEEVLNRITSKELYPGERDLFTNFMHPANLSVIGNKINEAYKSQSGHILVRVYPGGDSYDVFVLNDQSSDRYIKAKFHYQSR